MLLFIAVIMDAYTLFASGSRWAWAAFPIIVIVLITISKRFSLIKKLTSLIGMLHAAYQNPQLPVKSRVDSSVKNVISYY